MNYTKLELAEELLKRQLAKENLIDFASYVSPEKYLISDHIRLLCRKLEQVESGEIQNLLISMPPRHSKSFHVSIMFPCWVLGRNPTARIVQTGHTADLCLDHSRKARDIFASQKFSNVFPNVHHRPQTAGQSSIAVPKQTAHEWGTTEGGSYYAVGVEGSLTGRGFDFGIIDDPIKDAQEAESELKLKRIWDWYKSVFRTRKQNPNSRTIINMTRWAVGDLEGKIIKKMSKDPEFDQFEMLRLPALAEENDILKRNPGDALWPDKFPREYLLNTKATMGSRMFEALYQGNPTILEGNIIKSFWFGDYDSNRTFQDLGIDFMVQSYDTAFKVQDENDYSVCTTWGVSQSRIYLLDVWRKKVEFHDLKKMVSVLYNRFKPNVVLIEDKASGQSLIQELRRETNIPLEPIDIGRYDTKISRVNAITPLLEAGKVFIPENSFWKDEYLKELTEFPNAPHSDQVDSTSQALNYLRKRDFNISDDFNLEDLNEFISERDYLLY